MLMTIDKERILSESTDGASSVLSMVSGSGKMPRSFVWFGPDLSLMPRASIHEPHWLQFRNADRGGLHNVHGEPDELFLLCKISGLCSKMDEHASQTSSPPIKRQSIARKPVGSSPSRITLPSRTQSFQSSSSRDKSIRSPSETLHEDEHDYYRALCWHCQRG